LTGEITLRGAVAPVGGVKAKLLGARRVGLKKVILPWGNRRDVEGQSAGAGAGTGILESEDETWRRDLKCVFVRSVREAVDEAFGKGVLVWRGESEVMGMGMGDVCDGVSVHVPVLDESRL